LEESEYIPLLELFIETSLTDLSTLQSAVKAKNAEQAAKAAHSIKGAASNLGLEEFHEVVKEIEIEISNNQFQNILESIPILKNKLDVIAELLRDEEIYAL
jgi:HPt (histidine-containing phosphotransfer) domain-containing protein